MEKLSMDMYSPSITSLGGWGSRHTFTGIAFLVVFCQFFLRFNLSTTIVTMVNESATSDHNSQHADQDVCPEESQESFHRANVTETSEFNWSPSEQGLVLSSFFYGYILTQLPGGYISERLGGKWIVCIGLLGPAIINFLYPMAARENLMLFVVLRSIQGAFDGLVSTSVYSMFSKWIPQHERSFLMSVSISGAYLGIIVVMPACAITSHTFGWEAVFYASGCLALSVTILWLLLIYDSPNLHPTIREDERDYIVRYTHCSSVDELPMTPFAKILLSPCVLSMFLVHMAFCFGESLFSTTIPTYMADIQHYDIKTNGILSAAPFICNMLIASPYGWVLDKAIMNNRVTVATARKTSIVIALLGPAFCLVVMTQVGCERVLTVVLLCLAQSTSATNLSGSFQNPADLSPNYAGSLYGMMNPLGAVASGMAPLVMGWMTQDNETLSAWQNVFLLTTAVYGIATASIIVFGKFTVQDWNTYWKADKSNRQAVTQDDVEAAESCM